MKYFLLTDVDGRPWEILLFKKDVDRDEVRKAINDATAKYWKLEVNGYVEGYCQGEFVMNQLGDRYDFTFLPWSNDDVIYY